MLTEEFFKQSYSDSLIKNQLAKLNEEKEEALIDKDQESSRKKLIDDIMVMEPAAVLKFISQQYDMSGKEFLLKNVGWLAAYLVKNNFIKAKEIAKSIKDFNVKNIDDNSDIDYSNVEIDEDTFKESSMFDNEKEIKAIEDFIKQYQETQQEAEKEAQKTIKDAEKDIKDSGIDIPQEQLDDNTLDVLGVIDKEENKDKSPEELTKLVKDKIEKKTSRSKKSAKDKEDSKEDKKSTTKKTTAKKTTTKKSTTEQTKPVKQAEKKTTEPKKTGTKKTTTAKKSTKSKKANESDFMSAITPIAINEMLDYKLNEAKDDVTIDDIQKIAKQLGIKDFKNDVLSNFKNQHDITRTINSFFSSYNKNPNHAVEDLLYKTGSGQQQELLSEIICKLNPEAKKYFRNFGIDINEKIDEVSEKISAININIKDTKLLARYIPQNEEDANVLAKKLMDRGMSRSKAVEMVERRLEKAEWFKNAKVDYANSVRDTLDNNCYFYETGTKDAFDNEIKNLKIDLYEKKPFRLVATKTKTYSAGILDDHDPTKPPSTDEITAGLKKYGHILNTDTYIKKALSPDGKVSGKDLKRAKYILAGINPDKNLSSEAEKIKLDLVIGKFRGIAKNYMKDPEAAIDDLLEEFGDDMVQRDVAIETFCKMYPDAAEMFKARGLPVNGVIDSLDFDYESATVDGDSIKVVKNRIPDASSKPKEVAQMASDQEPKGFLGKLKSGLKQFGQAVAIAKLLKFAMNNAKTVTDMLGGLKMKFKEDANVVAEITTLVTNGEASKSNKADTKFSIRFDSSDLKWHATNLDNRKMKIDGEEELIKKVLDTDRGKEFKKKCLDNWEKILKPSEKGNNVLVYVLKNTDKLGIKLDKDMNKFTQSILRIYDNFDEVKKQFS